VLLSIKFVNKYTVWSSSGCGGDKLDTGRESRSRSHRWRVHSRTRRLSIGRRRLCSLLFYFFQTSPQVSAYLCYLQISDSQDFSVDYLDHLWNKVKLAIRFKEAFLTSWKSKREENRFWELRYVLGFEETNLNLNPEW
jgi:hypothetical protein